MQNKHQKNFLLGVSQPPGRGGGSSRLGQNPKFVKGTFCAAPLSLRYCPERGGDMYAKGDNLSTLGEPNLTPCLNNP